MPEASVYKYHNAANTNDNIGSSGEILATNFVADPQLVKNAPNRPFGTRITASDTAHVFAAARGADPVHYVSHILSNSMSGNVLIR
jgi:hypothetical protein